MPETDWLVRQKGLARELLGLALARREGVRLAETRRAEAERVARADLKGRARANLIESKARQALARANDETRQRLVQAAIVARRAAAGADASVSRGKVGFETEAPEVQANDALRQALQSASAAFEAAEASALASYETVNARLDEARDSIARARDLRDRHLARHAAVTDRVAASAPLPPRLGVADLNERLAEAGRLVNRLAGHEPSSRAYWLAVAGPFSLALALSFPVGARFGAAGAAPAVAAAIALGAGLAVRARTGAVRRMADDVLELDRTLEEAVSALVGKVRRLKKRRRRRRVGNARQLALSERQAREAFERAAWLRQESEGRRIQAVKARLAVLAQCRNSVAAWSREHLSGRLKTTRDAHRRELSRARYDYQSIVLKARLSHWDEYAAVTRAWEEGWAKCRSAAAAIERECEGPAHTRDSPDGAGWTPSAAVPAGVRIGELELRLDLGPDRPSPSASLPIILPTSGPANLVFEANDPADRPAVIDALNTVIARCVTSVPSGQLLLTVIDPVGGFLQVDPALSARVGTETAAIHALLDELLEEAPRGPCRMLVVADFPSAFDGPALERLGRVLEGGAGRRVLTLLGVDRRLPPGIAPDLLGRLAVVVSRRDGRFRLGDPDLSDFPVTLDPAPATLPVVP